MKRFYGNLDGIKVVVVLWAFTAKSISIQPVSLVFSVQNRKILDFVKEKSRENFVWAFVSSFTVINVSHEEQNGVFFRKKRRKIFSLTNIIVESYGLNHLFFKIAFQAEYTTGCLNTNYVDCPVGLLSCSHFTHAGD